MRDDSERARIRAALEEAAAKLLEGREPGPLTGLRLAELAGVKRHRLTHDNADLNESFQLQARAINRAQPAVDQLRRQLQHQREQINRLTAERAELRTRLTAYAAALVTVTEERDRLRTDHQPTARVTSLRR